MSSILEPIYSSFLSVNHTAEDNCSMILQFVKTTDVDLQFIYSISKDPLLSTFLHQVTSIFLTIKFDEFLNSNHEELSSALISFYTKIASSSPFLLDTVTASINYDLFVDVIFGNVSKSGDIRKIEPTKAAPYLKLLALLSSSQEVSINCINTMTIIYSIVTPLLNSPQLAAWGCAIYACLTKNLTSFESFIKSQPNIMQLRKDLTTLLSSNDMVVVCASLAAHTALFSINNDGAISMRAAVNFFMQNSSFILMKKLSAMSILAIKGKAKLDSKEISSMLKATLQSNGLDQYIAFDTLISMPEYYEEFFAFLQESKFFAALIKKIAKSPYDFVCISGCHFLQTINEVGEGLFNNIPSNNLFIDIYSYLLSFDDKTNTSCMESVLIIINQLMKESSLSQDEISLIESSEDQIFTMFLRHIELNNSFLALSFYRFIVNATAYLDKWETRLELIAIETQLVPLIIAVLQTSLNKCAIDDSLSSLVNLIGRDDHFYDNIVSGITLWNRKTNRECKETEARNSEQKRDLEKTIHQKEEEKDIMQSKIDELSEESNALKEEIETKTNEYNKLKKISETSGHDTELLMKRIEELESKNAELVKENEELSNVVGMNGLTIKRTIHENEELVQQLKLFQQSDRTKQKQIEELNEKFRKKSEEFTSLSIKEKESEHDLSLAHLRVANTEKELADTKEELHKQKTINRKLCISAEKIKKTLIFEQNRGIKLSEDISIIESRNAMFVQMKKNDESVKEKLKAKNAILKKKICEIEQEKNKWETIAKFNQKVKECKRDVAQEVYKPLY